MRYLTLKPNGKWQFRYQIPPKYQQFFHNRREVKKTLKNCSKRQAYLIGIEYELALKKFMSEIIIGNHTETFDEAHARTLIQRVAHTGISQIYTVVTRYRDEPAFRAALQQARATQDAIGGKEAVKGQFSLDLTFAGALNCLKNIYPDDVSAQVRAKELIQDSIMFDDAARNSATFDLFFNKLVMVFQHLINARIALENTDLKSASVIASQLNSLSTSESKAIGIGEIDEFISNQIQGMFERGRKVVADITKKPADKPKVVVNPKTVSIVEESARKSTRFPVEAALKDYYGEKKFSLLQKHKPKTEKEKKQRLKTLNQEMEKARVVFSLIGKDCLIDIERSDGVMTLEQLLLFPRDPIASRNKQYFEGIDKTEWIEVNAHVGHEVIRPETALKYLECGGRIFNWLIEHGKITYNPFANMNKLMHLDKEDDKEKKQPLSNTDLKQIFSHKVFSELKLGTNPITKSILDYQYWMPLTSYLSGLRPNELSQMKCGHVVRKHGIWCFQVTDSGERESVKNSSSRRFVPIHSKLLDLGLLSLIDNRAPEELLFKDLTYSNEGYFRKVGDWFKRTFVMPMSLNKEKKSYYSFRHNFMDPFIQSNQNGYIFKRLVGHCGEGIAERTYGREADIKRLKELVESFEYGDVLENVKPFFIESKQ